MTALRLLPILLVSVAAALAAQQTPFQGGIRLVRLDVSVLDGKQQPVRDLTAADFRITERGRPLNVRAFRAIEVPSPGAVSTPAQRGGNPPAASALPTTTDSAAETSVADESAIGNGRLIVLIMDDAMTPHEPDAAAHGRSIARAIVERMGPDDRIAVQFTKSQTTRLELTTDREQLLKKVATFSPGGYLAIAVSPSDREERPRFQRSLLALSYTIEAIGPLTDRQKMIAYVGPGLPIFLESGSDELGLQMPALFRDAERANVVIYTFDPMGLDGLYNYAYDRFLLGARMRPRPFGEPPPMSQLAGEARRLAYGAARRAEDFAFAVASNTGGRALNKTNLFEPGVDQMFADTGFYYLLAVEPLSAKPDGRFHEVTVKVTRPDVHVRARRGYYYTR